MTVAQPFAAGTLCLAAFGTLAAEFPQGSAVLTPEALSSALAGKVFTVKPSSGPNWRWQFNGSGYFFINVGRFADDGKWSVKESSLCTEGKKVKPSCNEVRSVGTELYLLRENGEVIKLELQ